MNNFKPNAWKVNTWLQITYMQTLGKRFKHKAYELYNKACPL